MASVKPDPYTVTVSDPGFATDVGEIEVTSGTTTPLSTQNGVIVSVSRARGGCSKRRCRGVASGAKHGARPLIGELRVFDYGPPVDQYVRDAFGLGVKATGARG